MRKMLKKWSLALSSCLIAATAQAGMVDFDSGLDTSFTLFNPMPLLTHGDALVQWGQRNYLIETISTKSGAAAGDLVGALIDGSDVANSCVGIDCPTNNNTTFLGMLNSAIPVISRLDGGRMNLVSFDASFIAFDGAPIPGVSLVMRVVGFLGSAVAFDEFFDLPGLQNGALAFNTYSVGNAVSQIDVDAVAFYGYACNSAGSCSRADNSAQFALDNIAFVPEPASMALVTVGLLGMGALRRRKQA